MTAMGPDATTGSAWRRHLTQAAGCAVLGLVVHVVAPALPVSLTTIGLGIGVIGAAFMLAWAADAGESAFSGGAVLAVVALVTVLPEFIIEVRFAFIQAAELVTANLTGATRLLLAGAAAMPLVVGTVGAAAHSRQGADRLVEPRRLELGVLLLASVFALQVAVRGSLSIYDGLVLLTLYVLYARRVQGTQEERPAVVGVSAGLAALPLHYRRQAIGGLIVGAGAVVVLIANPFADALLATGTSLGFDPYVLIQSVVPVATESPEFVVVAVLVANHRPAQGLALFLASSVSQWTLGMGALPLAYLAGGGGQVLPLAAREQLELAFTIALTLFVVAALSVERPARIDAVLVGGVFLLQLIYPTTFLRLSATFVLFVFAVDLLVARRRRVRPMIATVWRRGTPSPASPPGGEAALR